MALDQQSAVFRLRRFRNLEPQYAHHRRGFGLSRIEVGLYFLKRPPDKGIMCIFLFWIIDIS